jgi:hypothetical protein
MVQRDNYDNIKVVTCIASTTTAGQDNETDGTWIDTQGYESATMVFNVGAAGDNWAAALYYTLKIAESDASNGANPAAATDLIGANIKMDDEATYQGKSYKLGYIGSKRYITARVARTGNHATGTPIGATLILANARRKPVA